MDTSIFKSLGFSPNETKIYLALLDIKEGSIWNIATHAQIDRRNAYDAINRLVNRGFAFQILPKKNLTYAPAHPEKLKELLKEQVHELNNKLPALISQYTKINVPQLVCIYKGLGGLKNYIELELHVGKDIYGIASKGSWFDTRLNTFAQKASKKYKEKGIRSHIIYDENILNTETIEKVGGEYKILPHKYSTGSSVEIFGEYIAIYSGMHTQQLENDITIFILKDKTLARDFKKWWQFMWDMLPTIK
jgi:predicted transcriptional regulator